MPVDYTDEPLFVHGATVRHLASRVMRSEKAMAADIYAGFKSPGAAVQRLRLLKADGIRMLGTGSMDADEEARRLARVLGVSRWELVKARLAYVLVDPARGLVVLAGCVLAFDDPRDARIAAAVYTERRRDVSAASMVQTFSHGTLADLVHPNPWRLVEPDMDPVAEFQLLMDIQRYVDGDDSLLDAVAWVGADVVFTHLTWVFRWTPRGERDRWFRERLWTLIERCGEIERFERVAEDMAGRASELHGLLSEPWALDPDHKEAILAAAGVGPDSTSQGDSPG